MINNVLFRFLVVGGSVAVLQLLMLYIFHDLINLPSLTSSVIAFIISIFINFGFQKFWSFQDPSRDKMATQFSFFLVNALINLAINAGLMIVWLNFLHWNAYFSQALTLGLIAIGNFFIYKIIFNYKKNHPDTTTSAGMV